LDREAKEDPKDKGALTPDGAHACDLCTNCQNDFTGKHAAKLTKFKIHANKD
jgi:hypothetical protein